MVRDEHPMLGIPNKNSDDFNNAFAQSFGSCGVQLILSRLRTVLNTILSDTVTTLECMIFILAVVYAIVFFVGRRVAAGGGDTKPWVAFAIMIIVSIISLW